MATNLQNSYAGPASSVGLTRIALSWSCASCRPRNFCVPFAVELELAERHTASCRWTAIPFRWCGDCNIVQIVIRWVSVSDHVMFRIASVGKNLRWNHRLWVARILTSSSFSEARRVNRSVITALNSVAFHRSYSFHYAVTATATSTVVTSNFDHREPAVFLVFFCCPIQIKPLCDQPRSCTRCCSWPAGHCCMDASAVSFVSSLMPRHRK